MKAIILAAGKATRLLPLTKSIPQCMLRLGNETILEKQVKYLKNFGIDDITVITGYLSEKVEKFCNELGLKALFNPFYEVSGTALTLWVIKGELQGDFILFYSDVIFEPKIIGGLLKNKGDICLAIKKDGLREEAEKVIENKGAIEDVNKANMDKENGEFIGMAKFSDSGSKKLVMELDNISKISLNSTFIEVIDSLIKNGEAVSAYDIKDASFVDIDFPNDLEKAEKLFITKDI